MSETQNCFKCPEAYDSTDELIAHYEAEHGFDPETDRLEHPELGRDDIEAYRDRRRSDSANIELDASASQFEESPDSGNQGVPTKSVPAEDPAPDPESIGGPSDTASGSNTEQEQPADFLESEPATDHSTGDSDDSTVSSTQSDSSQKLSADTDGHLDRLVTEKDYKWFLFGVGGCGGNLIDAIILRSETLRDGHRQLADAWPDAVRGLASVNTNTSNELLGTYYAQEYRDESARDVAESYSVGPDGVQGAGAVEQIGAEAARWTFDQADGDFAGNKWGTAADVERINDAQAVIFLHSAVKGTGTGATPVIADELDKAVSIDEDSQYDLLNKGLTKFSVSVLPNKQSDEQEKCNGIVGFARLAQQLDAIIPLDNRSLEDPPDDLGVTIEGGDGYQFANYRDTNELLISFLETFTLSGVRIGGDGNTTMQGNGFDLEDAYNPARNLRSGERDDMAIVMAPAYGRIKTGGSQFDKAGLTSLVTNTLTEGKLVEFDHTTSWGGAFLVEAPKEQRERVETVFDNNFSDVIERPNHLNTGDDATDSPQMFPTRKQYAFRSDIDSVRLWALVYNPEMPRLTRWRNWAEDHRGGSQRYQKRLDEKWDKVESLFDHLGRENLA